MLDRDPLALAERYGPSALLLLVVAFMLWVRLLPADRVITDSAVFFSGNDPWYHKRMVHYAVRHFPATTPFDPWSHFPYGTSRHSGFGGLFDQLVALAALVVGLGSPSDHTIDVVLAVAPPVFGALTAVPTYVIASRLSSRWGGLAAAGLLALSGGSLLLRTFVGASDHQSAEAFFGAAALAGFAYAIVVAYRESPMAEDVLDRNWSFLRTPALAGVAGGIAIAAYLTMWAPGVMVLFTFGVFVAIQLPRDHYAGRPTDHLAFGTVVSMSTAGVLTLLYARSYTISSTEFSLLQPLVAFGLAAGTAVLLGLSRYAEREGYDRQRFPPVVGGLVLASLLIGSVIYPRSLGLLRSLFVRIYSFGYFTSATAGTVQEVQPPSIDQTFAAYGVVLFIALLGATLLAYRVWGDRRPTDLLVLLWSFTMFSAYFTMARFGYYFSVVVALLAAFAIWWIVEKWLAIDVDLRHLEDADVGVYQVIGLLVVLMLIVPGNVVAISGQQPAWETAENLGGTDQAWYDGLNWMQENTPEEPLDYYGQFDQPADRDFEYPRGAYGVMSWWDYGHWITVMGERIPYANPFQEGPRPASAYLQATNETRANLILDALPSVSESGTPVHDLSTEELRDVVANQSARAEHENGRYVVIDDQMAGGKFPAIATWTGPGSEAYFQNTRVQIRNQNATIPATSRRYGDTMLSTLYYRDARSLRHYRLVHEVDRYAIVGGYIGGQRVQPLTSLRMRGGWSDVSATATRVQRARNAGQALSLGQGSNQFVYDAEVESRVKVYERVEGATVTGTVPGASNGTPVWAILQLQTHTGRNFTYVQQTLTDRDGSFSMTVPYATDDAVDPAAGGTDSSVEALGQYDVVSGVPFAPSARGTTAVPEEAIYEGREIQVELTSTRDEEPGQQGNGTTRGGNDTASAIDPVTAAGAAGSGPVGSRTGDAGSSAGMSAPDVPEADRATAGP